MELFFLIHSRMTGKLLPMLDSFRGQQGHRCLTSILLIPVRLPWVSALLIREKLGIPNVSGGTAALESLLRLGQYTGTLSHLPKSLRFILNTFPLFRLFSLYQRAPTVL
jgi:hypothetical protein